MALCLTSLTNGERFVVNTLGEIIVEMNISNYIKDNKLKILVKPNSSKNEIIKYDSDKEALRVNIKALPESGKANLEVIKYFSKLLKKNIKIISGFKSKQKVLLIDER